MGIEVLPSGLEKSIKSFPHTAYQVVRLIDQPFTVEQKQSNTYIFKLQETLNNRRNLLRCRQIEAIEATITMLRKNIFSGLIKLPTGTGKTRLFAEMSGALDLSTLVLIPRVSLFRDTQIEFENLKKEGIISPDYYIQTIGGENKGSSSDQLKSILLAIDDNKPGVIVCTYQSLDSIAKSNPELFELLIHKIDLLVSDEAHRSLGKKTKKHIKVLSETERINTTRISGEEEGIIREIFEIDPEEELTSEDIESGLEFLAGEEDFFERLKALETEEYTKKLHLLFTATPNLIDKSVTDEHDFIIRATIEDVAKDGDLIVPSLRHAGIAKIQLSEEESDELDGKQNPIGVKNLEQWSERFVDENDKPIHEVLTEQYLACLKENENYLPAVAFCGNIRHAEFIKNSLIKSGVRAIRVTSSNAEFNEGVSANKAKRMLEANEIDIIVTVTKVSEGWDVQTLRCAIWYAPTLSPAKNLQGNGRIMRTITGENLDKYPEKDRGNTIIIEPSEWQIQGSKKEYNDISEIVDPVLSDEAESEDKKDIKYTLSIIPHSIQRLYDMGEVDAEYLRILYGENILQEGLPVAGEDGFFVIDEERFGTIMALVKVLGISQSAIKSRIGNIESKKGKDLLGHIRDFYPESQAREVCKDLLEDLPVTNEDGFFVIDGERYGTFKSLARALGIDGSTIRGKISDIESKKGKDQQGNIRDFYPESQAREVCKDLLEDLPVTNEDGFFVIDGEKYGTIRSLTKVLGISEKAITSRISNIESKKGKDKQGIIRYLYPESQVREVCKDLLEDLPMANENGFFEIDGEIYGVIRTLEKILGISEKAITSRIGNIESKKGKDLLGHIRDFYPESQAREVCKDLLEDLPMANENGFFEIDGEKYGTIGSLMKVLGVDKRTIKKRISSTKNKKGKDYQGVIRDFYQESQVREVCKDLLEDLPMANENGFFEIDGEKYGTMKAFMRALRISDSTIKRKIGNIKSKKGRNQGGQILDFYSESQIGEACKDLLNKGRN